jgi:hypothetical protein
MQSEPSETDPILEARYANYFKVGQNASEFLVQFGQFHPGTELIWIGRIVTGPLFMKELLRMITESVELHEAQYGPIPTSTAREES